MKTLYLVRHGETESNRKGIFRGRLDVPLSAVGIEQARGVAAYFKNIPLNAVFTSPLQRAVKTAEIAFPDLRPQTDPMLDNIDLGDWSGREKKLIQAQNPGEWQKWIAEPEKMKFPGGGETLSDVYRRTQSFLERFVAHPAERVAAVSHRSVTKVLLAAAVGLTDHYFWKFHLDNASVSILYHTPERGFTIYKLNHTDHLAATTMEWY